MVVNVPDPIPVTFRALNSMRKHNKGVAIDVGSSAVSPKVGFNSLYGCAKQAIICPTGNIEQELNI